MAVATDFQKFRSCNVVRTWDHDPGATSALITTPDGGTTKRLVTIGDYASFFVQVMATIATGGPTLVEIVCSDDSAGSTNLTQVKTSGTVAADAVGDIVSLEATVEEIRAASATAQYVAARITCANSADECSVTYIQANAKRAYEDLTPDSVIS